VELLRGASRTIVDRSGTDASNKRRCQKAEKARVSADEECSFIEHQCQIIVDPSSLIVVPAEHNELK